MAWVTQAIACARYSVYALFKIGKKNFLVTFLAPQLGAYAQGKHVTFFSEKLNDAKNKYSMYD